MILNKKIFYAPDGGEIGSVTMNPEQPFAIAYGIKHYVVSTEEDKGRLPDNTPIGFRCYVTETQKWYILDLNGEWVPFVDEGGSSGSSESSLFSFKGSVLNVSNLPSSGNNVGDVYHVQSTGSEYVWVSESDVGAWEELGETIDLSAYELKPTVSAPTGSSITITPADNTIYSCGELTSLAITDPPATGAYSIVFTSGSTATTTTIPSTILGLESFAAEANTVYEINVLDNRAVVGKWAVSA